MIDLVRDKQQKTVYNNCSSVVDTGLEFDSEDHEWKDK